MATLIASGETTGSAASHTGPCSVWVTGDLAGGLLQFEGGSASDKLAPMGRLPQVKHPTSFTVDSYGTYFLKATIVGATGTPTAEVITTQ